MGTTTPRPNHPGITVTPGPIHPRCDIRGRFTSEPTDSDQTASGPGVVQIANNRVVVIVNGITVARISDPDIAQRLADCMQRRFRYLASPVDGAWWEVDITEDTSR